MNFFREDLTHRDRQEMFHQDKSIFIGHGIDLLESYTEAATEKEVEVWNSRKERGGHTLVIGTTGSGKTVLLSNLAKQDILAGHRVVYVDPKGDADLFRTFVTYAKIAGRFNPDTFMFLSPMYLEHSIELNPLWGLDPDEAATVLVSAIPDGKEPFFKKVAFMVLLAILLSLAAEEVSGDNGERDYPSIYEVSEYFALDQLKTLRDRVEEILELLQHDKSSLAQQYAVDAALVLDHLTAADEAYFEKVTMTLKAEIDVLVTGAIGQVIGRAKTNKLVERLRDDKDVIFLAYLGALKYGDEIVGRGARMIFSSLQRLTGTMYKGFKKFDPPIAVYGDEAKNLFYDGIEDLFNKVRGANMMLTFATQSLGDIVATLGADKMLAIVGNTNIQIFMRATDKYTLDYVESSSEEVYVSRPNFLQHSLGLNQVKQRAILGPHLKKLRTGSFFAAVYGQWFRIYSPFEEPPKKLDFDPADIFVGDHSAPDSRVSLEKEEKQCNATV